MSYLFLVVALVLLLFLVFLPVLIGVLVYRDAKSRGMDPVLWALVAVLVPSFIGLIIYLVVRGGYSAAVCARCGKQVQEPFAACPYCGAALKLRCEACGCPVEADWKVCAQCGAPQPQGRPSPVNRQPAAGGKGLWALLIGLLIIPALILLGIIGFTSFTTLNIVNAQGGSVVVETQEENAAADFSGSSTLLLHEAGE